MKKLLLSLIFICLAIGLQAQTPDANGIVSVKFALENNISQKELNNCINKNLKLNFKDFINGYRIAHFKEMMLIDDHIKKHTVDAIVSIAGFSSRSSFYLAYKKQEGKFPKFIL